MCFRLVFLWSCAVCHQPSCRDLLLPAALAGSCGESRKWMLLGTTERTGLGCIHLAVSLKLREFCQELTYSIITWSLPKEVLGVSGWDASPRWMPEAVQAWQWAVWEMGACLVARGFVRVSLSRLASTEYKQLWQQRTCYKIQISFWGVVLFKKESVILSQGL